MATLNRIAEEKNKKNAKAAGGMSAAVASTEKIRKWVKYFHQSNSEISKNT
jgi:predicted transcriptional regulator